MVKPDIHTLAHHLKQERLYVNSDKQLLQRLNADVLKTAERLYRAAWIAKQQRINLDRLILTSVEASPAECCNHAKVLESTQFVDGYKQLGFQETLYGEFLNRLRENPRLVASCLVAGEKLSYENTHSVILTVFTSLYGNCIMQEDESYLLQVLRYLIEFELKESDNTRRLLRRGACAFSILFKLFSEGLYSAKLFLTATLHEPIMLLLVEDEDHLETDPNKLIERFSPTQQEKLFGEKGSENFKRKVQEMVESNEAKLVALVNKFIGYLKQNTYCFPHSLRWIVSQMYKTLSCVEGLDIGEVKAMCTDLLLAYFICPAVVNPEQYGIISDAPINEVARFNLMQVGKLLQQLAMIGSEEGDPRLKNSLCKFDKSCVAAFLDAIIGGRPVETPPMSSMNLLEGLSRTVIYMTHNQLMNLVTFTRHVMPGDLLREEDRMALENLIINVPHHRTGKSSSLELTPSSTPQLSPATTPANKKNRLPIAGRNRNRANEAKDQHLEHESTSQESLQEVQPEEVLVICLGISSQVSPGMMSENEVLSMQLAENGPGEVPVDDGPSNRSNSVSSLDLEGESVSELGAGPSGSNGVEALQLLEHEQGAAAENMLGSLLGLPGSSSVLLDPCTGSTISETTSEAWSVEVLPSDSEATDLKQEERLQELESCSGLGSTSDDTEVREVSSRPSTPGLSVVSGVSATSEDIHNKTEDLRSECSSDFGGKDSITSPELDDIIHGKKDSDDEKSNKSWWKKRFVSAIPKAPISFRKKDKQEKDKEDGAQERFQAMQDEPRLNAQTQAAEDILDKYRSAIKRASPNEAVGNDDVPEVIGDDSVHDSPRDDTLQNLSADDLPDSASQSAQLPDSTFSFRDAKKKLRMALCSADSVAFPLVSHSTTRNGPPGDNEIVCFLKVQLAEAINLQDKNLMAQIQETMRCVSRFDSRTCRKLLFAITEDYRKRAPYIAYLTRSRQGLQTTQAHLERLLQRVLRDKEVANRYFTTVCVRLLLESRETQILEFIKDFQSLTASDDKTALVEEFLQSLYGAMAQDVIWQSASEEQLQDAQMAIERSVMNRIFKLAFYPNQDGDILRDQLFYEHIQRLCKVVSANHKALQIPEVYLKEAPWPSAQSEIRTINAYKTPRDKVQCILRMCSTIMNLLSLANEDSVPGADDFVPVLVFVLIKANPPCLLSTVQYINNFYASRLSGEESYWWMQFTAAVEFIKTIDDRK
uniref:GTPase-activating protein and VPS9 domain-containing protein 1 n=1 Tax=Callorhinchus milii TaxID=7868 RepID=A0A4W3HD35_CALMI